MTELERRERHEAGIADQQDALALRYHAWLWARPHAPSLWMPPVANDDQVLPANDNIDMDEAA